MRKEYLPRMLFWRRSRSEANCSNGTADLRYHSQPAAQPGNSTNDKEKTMNTFWKASPWISKVIVLMATAVFVMISIEPLAHPAANAATQGIAFTSSLGATLFRVSFAGFPLGCAAFLAYCLLSSRRTLTGLIFSALVLGILLVVRVYGMEVDSTVQQSIPLVEPEIVLVAITLIGAVIEKRRESSARRAAQLTTVSSFSE